MLKKWLACSAFMTVAISAHADVYRCGNTYTQEPCAGGRTVDVSPALTDMTGPKTVVINLCRAPGGSLRWIPQQCSTYPGWTLQRTARVPANLPWQSQLEIARDQRAAAQALTAPRPVVRYSGPVQPSRKEECARWDERVKELDQMGRAGSQYYDLEWVRRERQAARDKQFRLRC